MPIVSKAEWRFMAARHPDILHRWQEEQPRQYKNLPERKGRKRTRRKRKY